MPAFLYPLRTCDSNSNSIVTQMAQVKLIGSKANLKVMNLGKRLVGIGRGLTKMYMYSFPPAAFEAPNTHTRHIV